MDKRRHVRLGYRLQSVGACEACNVPRPSTCRKRTRQVMGGSEARCDLAAVPTRTRVALLYHRLNRACLPACPGSRRG